jgi:hypothetical protein
MTITSGTDPIADGALGVMHPTQGSRVTARTTDARLVAKARWALAVWERRAEEPTSNLLGTGAITEFEHGVAALLGCRYALSLPSATLGLRVALDAAGVRPGDRVLVPAYDWTAALSAVESLGAAAVAVDVELPGCAMDPGALGTALDRAARDRAVAAVVVTHLFGVPARVEEIAALCRSSGIPLIEDCSQSLGATVGGMAVGSFGDFAVCSFGSNKILDIEDGGVVSTNDLTRHEQCAQLSQHPLRQELLGIDQINLATLALRLHPLAAILGVAELKDIAATLDTRRQAMLEVTQQLEQHDWDHAGRRGVNPIGPGLPVMARSDRHDAPPGIAFTPPHQHVITPLDATLALPCPRAPQVDRLVLLARPVGRGPTPP